MWLSQPRCGDRRLLDTRPFFGQARPSVLPGAADPARARADGHALLPRRTGISIRRGEKIRLTGAYDASLPHPRVMSIMHVYVARDPHPPQGCAPLPSDVRELQKSQNVRLEPPVVKVPLNGLNDQGHTFEITEPPWPLRQLSQRRRGRPARQPLQQGATSRCRSAPR